MMDASNSLAKLEDIERRTDEVEKDPRVTWGARGIGEFIGLNERDTLWLLQLGKIPAARKIGGRWCASKRELARFLVTGVEAER